MKPTIHNKLLGGFSGLLFLMVVIAGIGIFAVISLKRSALETARVGDRLNSISLEIQVHNLEAQRRARNYFLQVKTLGADKAREQYLDESDFEIHEMESLTKRAIKLAPTPEKREKFDHINEALVQYVAALNTAAKDAASDAKAEQKTASDAAYDAAADQLHDAAEDGELAGRDASESSQIDIEKTSARAVPTVIGVSILGFALALIACWALARAILLPIEHLRQIAENVSMGNLDVSVRRFSEDEIGDLSDSFSRMVTAVKFFRSEVEASLEEQSMEVKER